MCDLLVRRGLQALRYGRLHKLINASGDLFGVVNKVRKNPQSSRRL